MLRPGDEHLFTLDGVLKPPLSLWLLLLLALRGYLAWLISLTFMEDRSRLLQFFYTSTEQFVLALLVGTPALLVLLLISRLQRQLAPWQQRFVRFGPILLWSAWLLDGYLLMSLIIARFPEFSLVKAVFLFLWLVALWLLLFSRSLKRFWRLLAQSGAA